MSVISRLLHEIPRPRGFATAPPPPADLPSRRQHPPTFHDRVDVLRLRAAGHDHAAVVHLLLEAERVVLEGALPEHGPLAARHAAHPAAQLAEAALLAAAVELAAHRVRAVAVHAAICGGQSGVTTYEGTAMSVSGEWRCW